MCHKNLSRLPQKGGGSRTTRDLCAGGGGQHALNNELGHSVRNVGAVKVRKCLNLLLVDIARLAAGFDIDDALDVVPVASRCPRASSGATVPAALAPYAAKTEAQSLTTGITFDA